LIAVFVFVTLVFRFSETDTDLGRGTCNALVPINPEGLALVPPSGEGTGAFVSDQYCALSISIQNLNRRVDAFI
jgi:hypothetical protein